VGRLGVTKEKRWRRTKRAREGNQEERSFGFFFWGVWGGVCLVFWGIIHICVEKLSGIAGTSIPAVYKRGGGEGRRKNMRFTGAAREPLSK